MPEGATTDVSRLIATVERLTEALDRSERRQRRGRVLAVAAVLAIAGAALGGRLLTTAQAQAAQHQASYDPAAFEAAREDLMRDLTPEVRHEIERLEKDVGWVSRYMQLYHGQFDPGAMVAVMLGRMARSVEAVPDMRDEMRIMNAKMDALPIMAAEMQGMDIKMGVMAAGMDSTMGRAGRMMPWNW